MDAKAAAKPWWASQTVWGAGAAIAGGLAGAGYSAYHQDMPAALLSLGTAGAGFHALVGRFKADTPIGRALRQADAAVTAGLALEGAVKQQ